MPDVKKDFPEPIREETNVRIWSVVVREPGLASLSFLHEKIEISGHAGKLNKHF
jgi:hypothetical protein